MVSLKQIFDWFKEGLEPDEIQFKESWSSFWHKSENCLSLNFKGYPIMKI